MELSIKQTQAIDQLENNTTNVLCYGGGAGSGKSMLGCYFIIKQCLKFPNTRWVIGRSRLKVLRETTLVSFFEVCSMQGLTANVDYVYNEQKYTITFPSTQSVVLLKQLFRNPSDPEMNILGSLEITGCFIDEAAEISVQAYNVLQSRIRYRLDEHGLVPKTLLTTNPSKNWIFTDFWKPFQNGTLPQNKSFIQALVTDNPFISKHYIKQLQSMDNLNQRRLLFGDWNYSDDDTNLFSIDTLNDMFTNDYVASGTKYMSVDVARYGRDKSVCCIWDGLRCEEIKTWDKNSLAELATQVLSIARDNNIPRSNVIVDGDGIGGSIIDHLKGVKSFVNNSRAMNKENFKNLKSQCYFKFAQLVKDGLVYIKTENPTIKQQIISEFELVKQHDIDKENKKAITPKENIKSMLGRSPDIADALIMRCWFEFNKSKILYFG